MNGASPVVFDNQVFVTASYGIGSAAARIEASGAEVLWRDPDILASQYTTCIAHEGHLFGIDGRQDGPAADLKCFDPVSRETRWTERSFGYATLLKADDKLLIVTADGEAVLAAPDTGRYRELARARIADTTARALPALADGRLYVRDTRTLRCFELSRPQE